MASSKDATEDIGLESGGATLDLDLDEFEIEVGTTNGTVDIDLELSSLQQVLASGGKTQDINFMKATKAPLDEEKGLQSFLNAVADQMDREKVDTKDSQTLENVMMSSLSLEGGVAASGGDGDSCLMDLMSTLKQNITSEWLTENTAEKWQQENPKLAEEFKKQMEADKDKEY